MPEVTSKSQSLVFSMSLLDSLGRVLGSEYGACGLWVMDGTAAGKKLPSSPASFTGDGRQPVLGVCTWRLRDGRHGLLLV
ncbi:hypothetical protein F4809DRAFT_580108 [Biscogniauxia mediterranea]|nr:hypothetical protein F4809DRAFT_580108 [Biscogniauxia mediterranea]